VETEVRQFATPLHGWRTGAPVKSRVFVKEGEMVALTFSYMSTDYIRVATCGGMDSEFSHTAVTEKELTVVVPEDNDYWRTAARNYVERYSGNIHDKAFAHIGSIRTKEVSAILHETRRLDI